MAQTKRKSCQKAAGASLKSCCPARNLEVPSALQRLTNPRHLVRVMRAAENPKEFLPRYAGLAIEFGEEASRLRSLEISVHAQRKENVLAGFSRGRYGARVQGAKFLSKYRSQNNVDSPSGSRNSSGISVAFDRQIELQLCGIHQ